MGLLRGREHRGSSEGWQEWSPPVEMEGIAGVASRDTGLETAPGSPEQVAETPPVFKGQSTKEVPGEVSVGQERQGWYGAQG